MREDIQFALTGLIIAAMMMLALYWAKDGSTRELNIRAKMHCIDKHGPEKCIEAYE